MLTKKHFETIARIIRESTSEMPDPLFPYFSKEILTRKLADYFETQNGRFQFNKFLEACYK